MAGSLPTAPGRIFMSYRRDDSDFPASWLYERLVARFGRDHVFKDVDSIELGDDFAEVIAGAVSRCDVLLALIGKQWLTITDEAGNRRLDDPDDFVRLEIEAALQRKVRVIPILVGNARMPRADQLPASLAKLVRRQALVLNPNRFESDTTRLIRVVDKTIAEEERRRETEQAAMRAAEDRERQERNRRAAEAQARREAEAQAADRERQEQARLETEEQKLISVQKVAKSLREEDHAAATAAVAALRRFADDDSQRVAQAAKGVLADWEEQQRRRQAQVDQRAAEERERQERARRSAIAEAEHEAKVAYQRESKGASRPPRVSSQPSGVAGPQTSADKKPSRAMWRLYPALGLVLLVIVIAVVMSNTNRDGGGGGGSGGIHAGDGQIELMVGFGGDQLKALQAETAAIGKELGITIKFTDASRSFDSLIRPRVQGGNPPDIALFPQPGQMLDFARQGKLADLSTVLDLNRIKSNLVPGELDAATGPDGKIYGVPVSMWVRSLVWYPKKAFEAKGYTVPTTIAELEALTNQIKADGTTPWCVGIESGAATGWPATDWIEDFVLRYGGPEKYGQWVRHEIPFNDPVVVRAAQKFEKLALADGNVFGGRKSVSSNNFATAANPMFQKPTKCFLHKQGNFITLKGYFPERIRANLDTEVGVFQLPGTDANNKPVVGGSDLLGLFNFADEDVRKITEAMTNEKFGTRTDLARKVGWISPYKTFDLNKYPDGVSKKVAELAYGATVFQFDGSDQMPAAVGAGSFWRGMTAWIGERKSLENTLRDIEESWPT